MRRTTDLLPRPIALFVDRSDPATIAAAMEAGVSAYVVKGLAQDRVQAVVDVAVAHFNRYHAMREELDRARLSLVERKTVDRAKGLLMEQKALSEEAAYAAAQAGDGPEQAHRRGRPEIVTYAKVLKPVIARASRRHPGGDCPANDHAARGSISRGSADAANDHVQWHTEVSANSTT